MQEYRQEKQENRLEADPSRYVLPPKFGQKRRAATFVIFVVIILILIIPDSWSHRTSLSSLVGTLYEEIHLVLSALIELIIAFVATKIVMKIYRKIRSYRPLSNEKHR